MSKSILIFIFILSNSALLYAQDTSNCGFEVLFNIKAGMSKGEAMDLLGKDYQANLVTRELEKLAPYQGSTDSIVNERLIYTRDVTPCFNGANTKVQLEFADNVLFKAYISTTYPKTSYEDMMANFNSLKKVIKAKWTYEKEIKISGENMLGFGYDYTKTKKTTAKPEKISLHYIDYETNNPTSNYILEVLWANLKNTKMNSSNY